MFKKNLATLYFYAKRLCACLCALTFFSVVVHALPLEQANLKPGMRVGFYTGSFDPFHKGHASIAEKALEHCDIVIVDAEQAISLSKPNRTHYTYRHQMLEAYYKEHPRVFYSIERQVDIQSLLKHKEVKIIFIVGSDYMHDLCGYPFAKDEFIIHMRPGHTNTKNLKKIRDSVGGKPVHLIYTDAGDISSSRMRKSFSVNKEEGLSFVPKAVQEVIKKHNLYQ